MNDSRTRDNQDPDLDAEPTPEELAAAEALRDALSEWPRQAQCDRRCQPSARADLEFALAIRHAARPDSIDRDRHDRILARAMTSAAPARSRRPKPLPMVIGAASVFALAAALVLALIRLDPGAPMGVAESPPGTLAGTLDSSHLVPCRSTAQLFDTRFPVSGGTTDRIDRIALARERDLRSNLFEQWRAP